MNQRTPGSPLQLVHQARRRWLRMGATAGAGLAASALPLSGFLGQARAGDYRAIVCVFLNGGNDGNDSLIPIDTRYDAYSAVRGSMAIPKDSLAPLGGTHDGGRYAMHPGLKPLAPMFDAGRLAWVANVGPLIEPLTIEDARAGRKMPPFLLSHSEQVAAQNGWLYSDDQSGWGGRAIEAIPDSLRGTLGNISLSDNAQLVSGRSSPPRLLRMVEWSRYWGAADLSDPNQLTGRSLRTLYTPDFADPVQAAYARLLRDATSDAALLAQAFNLSDAGATFPSTEIGGNMKEIAQMISVRNAVGATRQVFNVDWGTFDSHGHQRGTENNGQDGQLAELGAALSAFDQALKAQGVSDRVTTFVMTDMGRTFKPSGEAGTDHAWGNHWFVFGDAVKGGKIYGQFPTLTLGGPDDYDIERRGRWLPTTATDQFAATLVSWLGVADADLDKVLPNLKNFSQRSLGFI